MRDEYYCTCCGQNKHISHFTKWLDDKTKPTRCDDCLDYNEAKRKAAIEEFDRRLRKKIEREAESPILKKLSKTLYAKSKVMVRDRIYDLQEKKRIDDEIGF
jgi:hypothetical protein